MLIEKADMLDALLGNFAGMDLLTDAAEGNCVVLGYVTGWLDALGTLIHVEKKKQDERKALLEQLKQSCARTNADGFCDTAEEIEEELEKIAALDAEDEERWKCVGTGVCVKMDGGGDDETD
nr:MAG TPA: hypothetical protein [Caudoviricetes sp.]